MITLFSGLFPFSLFRMDVIQAYFWGIYFLYLSLPKKTSGSHLWKELTSEEEFGFWHNFTYLQWEERSLKVHDSEVVCFLSEGISWRSGPDWSQLLFSLFSSAGCYTHPASCSTKALQPNFAISENIHVVVWDAAILKRLCRMSRLFLAGCSFKIFFFCCTQFSIWFVCSKFSKMLKCANGASSVQIFLVCTLFQNRTNRRTW